MHCQSHHLVMCHSMNFSRVETGIDEQMDSEDEEFSESPAQELYNELL